MGDTMSRYIIQYAIVGIVCIVGCNGKATSDSDDPPSAQPAGRSSNDPSGPPISFDETNGVISIDPAVDIKDKRRFDFALGSVTVEIFGHSDGKLVFEYTTEIEGGYTVYRCQVPISASLVTIQIRNDGGIDPKTSFDLGDCAIVRTGNALLD